MVFISTKYIFILYIELKYLLKFNLVFFQCNYYYLYNYFDSWTKLFSVNFEIIQQNPSLRVYSWKDNNNWSKVTYPSYLALIYEGSAEGFLNAHTCTEEKMNI